MREEARLYQAGEELGALDDARPGAVEVGVAVGGVRPAVPHRRKLTPLGLCLQSAELAPRLLETKAARHQDDDFRTSRRERRPVDRRTARARLDQLVGAAGDLDQLRDPVAR